MKKFNLNEALAGKPVVTRSGNRCTKLSLVKGFPLVVHVEGTGWVFYEKENGYCSIPDYPELDLGMDKTVRSGWVNLYGLDGNSAPLVGAIYNTKEAAVGVAKQQRCKLIDTVEITWED